MEGRQPRLDGAACLTLLQTADKLRVFTTEFAVRRPSGLSPGAVGKENAQENVSAQSPSARQSAWIPCPHEKSWWAEGPGEAAGKGSPCPHRQLREISRRSRFRRVRQVSPNPGASAAERNSSESTAMASFGRAPFFPPFSDKQKQGSPARQDWPSVEQ